MFDGTVPVALRGPYQTPLLPAHSFEVGDPFELALDSMFMLEEEQQHMKHEQASPPMVSELSNASELCAEDGQDTWVRTSQRDADVLLDSSLWRPQAKVSDSGNAVVPDLGSPSTAASSDDEVSTQAANCPYLPPAQKPQEGECTQRANMQSCTCRPVGYARGVNTPDMCTHDQVVVVQPAEHH